MPVEAVLAVDLGGTSMRAALVDPEGRVRGRAEEPTPPTPDPRPLHDLVAGVRAAGDAVGSAVVGVPGRVEYGTGRLEHAPNLADGWAEHLDESSLGEALGLDVALANDADLAAVGEAWFGAGRHHADVAYLTVSTGIGAGVVTGGLLVHGRRSLAELGHTIVDRRGLPSPLVTVEALGSGTALARLAAEAGLDAPGPEVDRLRRAGDVVATGVWDAVVAVAAVGAVNLAWLFSPEVVVVGGGLGLVGTPVLEPIRRLLESHGPAGLAEPIAVVNAELGDDAGLAGAAAWHRAFSPEAASRVPAGGRR